MLPGAEERAGTAVCRVPIHNVASRAERILSPMAELRSLPRYVSALALCTLLPAPVAHAWGRDGHRLINRLAVQNLPHDVPAFLRNGNAVDIVEYMGPEPDQWRNKAEDELSNTQAADHFIDLEWADLAGTPCAPGTPGCGPDGEMLPKRRFDFIRALQVAQKQHPELDLSPAKVGLQPWQVEEVWERLKSDLRDYRRLQAANDDLSGIQTIVLYEAGWLGHYVADGSQPLHVSINYNGWVEKTNPHGYTTEHHIHSQFESVYVTANLASLQVAPLVAASEPKVVGDEWTQYLDYLHHTGSFVEQTYALEKAGAFQEAGTPEGKTFTEERLAAGAVELRNLIYSAWVHSADPVEEFHGAK